MTAKPSPVVERRVAAPARSDGRRALPRPRAEHVISPLLLAVLIASWELTSRHEWLPPVVVSAPSQIVVALLALLQSDYIWSHILATLYETLLGFAIASIAGFALGVLLVNFELFRKVLHPYIVVFQVVPKVALAPIFITWFGFGFTSKIVMAAAISFFPVVVNTVVGLESPGENERLLMRSLVASRRQVFFKLALPASLPYVFAGLKTSMTLALIGAIVAEFVAARYGLALLIETFNHQFKMAHVFAVLLILSVLGLALYWAMEYLDHRVVFWRERHDEFGS